MNTTHSSTEYHDIPALKECLRIPEVWQVLGLEGQPSLRCRSPFRPDKTPSFSIYDGGRRWKDFGTGQSGDVIDFIATARQLSKGQALRQFLEISGVPQHTPPSSGKKPPRATPARSVSQPVAAASTMRPASAPGGTPLPAAPAPADDAPGAVRVPLQRGTEKDWQQVAQSRRITQEAVSLALGLRTLTFGIVQGFQCWILTDAAQRSAEARRMDGQPFPECGTLHTRKAHTLRGSSKSWPLGAAVLRTVPQFRTLLIVEGGPDYLAALHFAHELERWDVLPVAMLGRSTGGRIADDALELMRGRRVRIYPHADADGGGVKSAEAWATQLHQVGCTVDLFEFGILHRADGQPIKDLNDCTSGLDETSAAIARRHLLPRPDLEVHPPY